MGTAEHRPHTSKCAAKISRAAQEGQQIFQNGQKNVDEGARIPVPQLATTPRHSKWRERDSQLKLKKIGRQTEKKSQTAKKQISKCKKTNLKMQKNKSQNAKKQIPNGKKTNPKRQKKTISNDEKT